MKATITLNENVRWMLDEWQFNRLKNLREEIRAEEREAVKNARLAVYKTIANADYGELAQMYLEYQEIETRCQSE